MARRRTRRPVLGETTPTYPTTSSVRCAPHRTSALARPLSSDARRRLSELFFLQPEFSAPHERPDRFFWSEVERIVSEDGALATPVLGAEATLFAVEPARPRVTNWQIAHVSDFIRLRGVFIGPVLSATHTYATGHFQTTSSQPSGPIVTRDDHLTLSDDRVSGGAQAEGHLPMGWHWQLDGSVRATAPLRPDEHGFTLSSAAQVMWLVADRWRSTVFANHSRQIFEPRHGDEAFDSWDVLWGAALSRFIEDHIEAFVQFEQRQARPAPHATDLARESWLRESHVQLGFQYRFQGALEAPGLFARQTMFPMQ